MSEPKSNPYIDETLMTAYVAYSPAENAKYLRQHAASNKTQAIAATSATGTTNIQPKQPLISSQYAPYNEYNANSQQTEIIDEHVTGVPIGDGSTNAPPLSYSQLSSLKSGDILYVLEVGDEEEEYEHNMVWSRVTFIGLEEDGFRVKTNVVIPETDKFEEIFYNTLGDDTMPVIYKQQENNNNNNNNNTTNDNTIGGIDYTLKDFDYKIGGKIFVYDDANNFIFYTIETYDSKTTKATLKDKSGIISSLYLKNFKHENAESESKAIVIKGNKSEEKKEDMNIPKQANRYQRIGQCIDIQSIAGPFHWVKRTNTIKLKWISYKNTLLGTIAGATKHLYPISLDYKSLNFMSGIGLGFNWLDIEDDEEDDEDEQVNVIEEHMKLFLCDSQLDSTLNRISKYSYYKFERHTISEILYDEVSGIKRLMELEQYIIKNINNNICTITNDEQGHLGLIVGYIQKPINMLNNKPTVYLFKVKKFGVYKEENKEEISKKEYIGVDLYNQEIIITMEPPEKDKKYSFSHSFNPKMLHDIINDLILNYNAQLNMKQEIDLFGRNALIQMCNEMNKGKQKEKISSKLSKETIYALIRLFDSRKTMIEFIQYIDTKIKNAFHSQTGSEQEWKFPKEYDISDQLNQINNSLKQETNVIRMQQKIFENYILDYNGKPFSKIQWEAYDRAAIKSALVQIVDEEDKIFDNLKILKAKLAKYLNQ